MIRKALTTYIAEVPPSEELRLSLHEMLDLLVGVEQGDEDFEQEVKDTVRDSVRTKLIGYQRFFSFADAQVAECDQEIERLRRRKTTIANAVKRVRGWLAASMSVYGIKSLNAGQCTFSLCAGRKTLDVFSPDSVPAEYKREVVSIEVNSTKLKHDLETWREGDPSIPGAQLIEGDPYITVR